MPEAVDVQRLVWLIHQHLKEDITEEEREELSTWKAGPGNMDLFDQVTSEGWIEKELPSYNEFEKQSGEDWKKIKGALFRRNVFGRIGPAPSWWRYAAAAIIFLGLTIAVLRIFVAHPTQSSPPVLAENRPVQHSKRSVTLLLQDGTVIQLEGERSGIVTKQGPIKVVKKKNQLFYVRKTMVVDSSMPAYIPEQEFTAGPLLGNLDTTKKAEQPVTLPENKDASASWNTLKVPTGAQFTISLPDGSKIWVNAESILRYPVQFTGRERRVYLSGEAYFEVSSNPEQPFIVSVQRENDTAATEFRAIGTKFNIRAYSDEPGIIATVVEGKVQALAKGQAYLIPLHAQLQWKNGNYAVVNDVKDHVVTSWKDSYFELNGATIEEVMNLIKRWYGIEVILKKVDMNRTFEGRIPKNTPFPGILETLKINGYRIEIAGNVVTISDQ